MKYLFLILGLLLFSCSSYKFKYREGKDLKLTKNNSEELNGSYMDAPIDSLYYSKNFFEHFNTDTLLENKQCNFEIKVLDEKHLKVELIEDGNVIDSIIIKGKYSKGYFKLKKTFSAEFVLGPILWGIGDDIKYIGLTKSKDIVLLNAYGGVMFLVIMPLRGAESSSFNIYRRINQTDSEINSE